jgi:hypothetical protein
MEEALQAKAKTEALVRSLHSEATLRESEARYRELFESNPHPMGSTTSKRSLPGRQRRRRRPLRASREEFSP